MLSWALLRQRITRHVSSPAASRRRSVEWGIPTQERRVGHSHAGASSGAFPRRSLGTSPFRLPARYGALRRSALPRPAPLFRRPRAIFIFIFSTNPDTSCQHPTPFCFNPPKRKRATGCCPWLFPLSVQSDGSGGIKKSHGQSSAVAVLLSVKQNSAHGQSTREMSDGTNTVACGDVKLKSHEVHHLARDLSKHVLLKLEKLNRRLPRYQKAGAASTPNFCVLVNRG